MNVTQNTRLKEAATMPNVLTDSEPLHLSAVTLREEIEVWINEGGAGDEP